MESAYRRITFLCVIVFMRLCKKISNRTIKTTIFNNAYDWVKGHADRQPGIEMSLFQ